MSPRSDRRSVKCKGRPASAATLKKVKITSTQSTSSTSISLHDIPQHRIAAHWSPMAGFLGAKVQLILSQPPNTEVHGTVQDIVAGQTLSLVNVYFPATGAVLDALTVQSASIADVRILPSAQQFAAPPPPPALPPQPVQRRVDTVLGTFSDKTPAQVSSSSNIDPAILSYDRAPYRPPPQQQPVEAPASLPIRLTHGRPEPLDQPVAVNAAPDESAKKRQRRPKQRLPDPSQAPQEPAPVIDIEVSRNGNVMNNTVKRGKGWRQTPLLQPTQSPAKSSKRSRKQRQAEGDGQNGWATEDATDIQDMGEFDFEANHKLFDKQQVFDDLRKGDTTADEDRLVGHNRLAPRKNLLPSENVLSPKLELDDKGSDADTEIDFQTGRSSSRHSFARRQQSRQNSHQHDAKNAPAPSVSRSATTSSRTGRPLPVSATIKAGRNFSPHSITSSSAAKRANSLRTDHVSPAPPSSGLIIAQTNALCPTLHPSALELLEKEACSRYGLLVEAVVENAARGVAEQAVSMINSPAEVRRGSRVTTSKIGMSSSAHGFDSVPPVIVVLTGNHTTGSRAVAAARHLSSRGYKIIIAEGHFALAAHDQDEQYAKQLSTVKRMMRSGANIKRGTWSKANAYIKNLNGPPVLILDALLAGARHEDILDAGRDAEAGSEDVRKMIDWANRSRAPVLSITCPSGLSDHDGSATIVDGEPLAVRADKLIALGAPVTGVLEALKVGEHFDISLADIGINIALKADDAVNFGSQWLTQLTFTTAGDHEIEE